MIEVSTAPWTEDRRGQRPIHSYSKGMGLHNISVHLIKSFGHDESVVIVKNRVQIWLAFRLGTHGSRFDLD